MPVLVTDATKMTLYDDGSDVYIFAVGMGLHDYTEPSPYSASVMFSAKMNFPFLTWDFCVNYNKDKTYFYTDIDCSDHYVAVTAVDGNMTGYVCISQKSQCFFADPVNMDTYYWGDRVENYQIRVTGMSDDRFTVAYQPESAEWINYVHVPLPLPSVFDVTSTAPLVTSPYGQDPWSLATGNGQDVLFANESMQYPVVPMCIDSYKVDFSQQPYGYEKYYVNLDEQICVQSGTIEHQPDVTEVDHVDVCRIRKSEHK